jgi:hypothetical protein
MRLFFLFLLMALFLWSCGKKSSRISGKKFDPDKITSFEDGIYQAILKPMNIPHTGPINASINIVKSNDELRFHMRFRGLSPEVIHPQNIHSGFRCPDDSDDLNQDGYIDASEGRRVYKEILIPLDDELKSQRVGSGIFPISNQFGQYLWSRSTSLKNLLNDLYDEDIHAFDEIIKLKASETFRLRDKVVVISGIEANHPLPESIQVPMKLNPHQSFPIACGMIKKLTHVPGRIDNDQTDFPLPDGEYNRRVTEKDDGADFERTQPDGVQDYGNFL